MKTFLICALILAGALAFGASRQRQLVELRRRKAELQAAVGEISRYRAELAQSGSTAVDTNELERLRGELPGLMKMRSQITRLRQTAKAELPTLKQQVATTEAQGAQWNARRADLVAQRAAKLHSSLVKGFLEFDLLQALTLTARTNGGVFASSFDQLAALLEAGSGQQRRWLKEALSQTNQLDPAELEIINRPLSVSAQQFEFVPASKPLTIEGPPMLSVREAAPRPLPDDKFARYYGLTDGQATEAIVPDGDFSSWEQQHGQRPPPR
jgi:hypothetical protein